MSPRQGLDQQTILQAAAEIADERGLQEVTMALLSQKLGVRSPSLYNHVESLSGLRFKLTLHGLKCLNEKMLRSAFGRSGDDAVFACAKAYIEFAREHPGLYEATLASQIHTDDPEWKALSNELVQQLIELLRAYDLEYEEAIHLVRGLRSILHGFASLERAGGFGMPIHLDDSINRVLSVYLRGIHVDKK
ncbi:TetR/AcrR family transcriptional regulator [Paenibacillus radicis (ex Gao et al. 2016)]|uniref:TetR family transcriptional regulator n=1 Tax=Paenibacillus radicis (ex Gao et al. 2016) TaxID=1737354 RepID=A0A917H0N8_9BACL|nr:TetR-like C-terminal domain-containing protein [Paenibacillus radicis (ex Gao et al. 2016)]GGG63755.1 TetR family transcriptional regulator [Paenibacillus radicis (ex Gao et al. 2016)]